MVSLHVFFMQFKAFPIAYVMRPLNAATLERVLLVKRTGIFTEDLKQACKPLGTIAAMTHLLIASTVLGYLSMCAGSLLRGQDMLDPEDPKVWTAAVIKGDGLASLVILSSMNMTDTAEPSWLKPRSGN